VKTLFMNAEKLALFVAKEDAEHVLEPLVDSLLGNGLTQAEVLDAVAASAERVLRTSLTDAGLPVSQRTGVKLRTTTVDREAQHVAKKLIERLTVTNPDTVPPVSKRRGLPAAVAARLA
jgi:hypothetical protein